MPKRRKVERPPHQRLLQEVLEMGYLAVGRKYGVSDTSVKKWLRQYERESALREGRDPKVVKIPTRTWPNRRRDRKAA
jgi:transposase-like protein